MSYWKSDIKLFFMIILLLIVALFKCRHVFSDNILRIFSRNGYPEIYKDSIFRCYRG